MDCTSPGRDLLAIVDGESGKRTKIVPTTTSCDSELVPIVIKATAVVNGVTLSATAQIGVSDNVEMDSVLAVARSTAKALDFTLLDTFQG